MKTLVDSNVWIDVKNIRSKHFDWSSTAIKSAAQEGRLIINPIVWSETVVQFNNSADQIAFFDDLDVERCTLPWDAAALAGRIHIKYRKLGGPRARTLPDFYIGAHAQVEGLRVLSRDKSVFRHYFPGVPLITPKTDAS